MKIAFGCDSNAVDLKLALIAKARQLGHETKDFGAEDPIYANTAVTVAKTVVAGESDWGVLVYGTGVGVPITVNKVKGAYCACAVDTYQTQRVTLSNNANLITMGPQVVGVESAEMFLEEHLKYTFNPALHSGAKVVRVCEFEREDQALLSVADV